MLWMVKKVFFGQEGEILKKYPDLKDMNLREMLTIIPLIIMVFWMGLFPSTFLSYSKASLSNLTINRQEYRLRVSGQEKVLPKIGDSREF